MKLHQFFFQAVLIKIYRKTLKLCGNISFFARPKYKFLDLLMKKMKDFL